MKASYTDIHNKVHAIDIEVLVKNERVVVCKVSGAAIGPSYLHYHAATGWKDLDNGDTLLSRMMKSIVRNPFEIF
jgi:hypothetical protein